MNYPQLSGEPNFVLIGVSAVFGLLVIIMVYYIFISKKSNNQSQNYSTMATMSNLMLNPNLQSSSPTKNNSPVSINNNYASIPTSAPVATLSNVSSPAKLVVIPTPLIVKFPKDPLLVGVIVPVATITAVKLAKLPLADKIKLVRFNEVVGTV